MPSFTSKLNTLPGWVIAAKVATPGDFSPHLVKSVQIDESTNASVSQVLAIVVCFCQDSAVHDALLDIVQVKEGTTDALYRPVKKLLNDKKIPFLVGFAADNCATMMGSASGFQAQLKADLPDVFVLGCVCHSFALCASHASEQLPSWLEKFLKDVCS